jgi:hypothetical protein
MKYRYRIEKFVYHDEDEEPIMVMEEDKYRLVAQFLISDVQGPGSIEYVLEAFDNVLSAKSKEEKISGNVCALEINNDTTVIYDKLAEDGMGDWCEVETKELKALVDIWLTELEKFRAQKKR